MAEVVVTIAGVVLFRYAEHSAGVAPETANARAAVTHALADAIAALAALPVPCPHQDLLRQIGQRLKALDTPDALVALSDLDQSTRRNSKAINRALGLVGGAKATRTH